jgi:hypothetical protein
MTRKEQNQELRILEGGELALRVAGSEGRELTANPIAGLNVGWPEDTAQHFVHDRDEPAVTRRLTVNAQQRPAAIQRIADARRGGGAVRRARLAAEATREREGEERCRELP